jgi:hypothetical protein
LRTNWPVGTLQSDSGMFVSDFGHSAMSELTKSSRAGRIVDRRRVSRSESPYLRCLSTTPKMAPRAIRWGDTGHYSDVSGSRQYKLWPPSNRRALTSARRRYILNAHLTLVCDRSCASCSAK